MQGDSEGGRALGEAMRREWRAHDADVNAPFELKYAPFSTTWNATLAIISPHSIALRTFSFLPAPAASGLFHDALAHMYIPAKPHIRTKMR